MHPDRIVQNIRNILLSDWDPFGVGDNPNLSDEYDHFINGILEFLKNECSEEKLLKHLANLEEKLHAPISENQRIVTAKKLLIAASHKQNQFDPCKMKRDDALKLDTQLLAACANLDYIAHFMKNNLQSDEYKDYIKHVGASMAELIEISNALHHVFPDIVPSTLQP